MKRKSPKLEEVKRNIIEWARAHEGIFKMTWQAATKQFGCSRNTYHRARNMLIRNGRRFTIISEHTIDKKKGGIHNPTLKLKEFEKSPTQISYNKRDNNSLLLEAKEIVSRTQNGSITKLGKVLGISFNRAKILVEQMESEGIVGPNLGMRVSRQVLVGRSQNDLESAAVSSLEDLILELSHGSPLDLASVLAKKLAVLHDPIFNEPELVDILTSFDDKQLAHEVAELHSRRVSDTQAFYLCRLYAGNNKYVDGEIFIKVLRELSVVRAEVVILNGTVLELKSKQANSNVPAGMMDKHSSGSDDQRKANITLGRQLQTATLQNKALQKVADRYQETIKELENKVIELVTLNNQLAEQAVKVHWKDVDRARNGPTNLIRDENGPEEISAAIGS